MILHDELAIKLAENAKIIYGTFYTGQCYELIFHKIQSLELHAVPEYIKLYSFTVSSLRKSSKYHKYK